VLPADDVLLGALLEDGALLGVLEVDVLDGDDPSLEPDELPAGLW
jgi:hypothetical protein